MEYPIRIGDALTALFNLCTATSSEWTHLPNSKALPNTFLLRQQKLKTGLSLLMDSSISVTSIDFLRTLISKYSSTPDTTPGRASLFLVWTCMELCLPRLSEIIFMNISPAKSLECLCSIMASNALVYMVTQIKMSTWWTPTTGVKNTSLTSLKMI